MKSIKSYLLLYAGFALLAVGLANYHMGKTADKIGSDEEVSDNNINPPLGPSLTDTLLAGVNTQNEIQTTPSKTGSVRISKNNTATASNSVNKTAQTKPKDLSNPPASQPKTSPAPKPASPAPIPINPVPTPVSVPSATPISPPPAQTNPVAVPTTPPSDNNNLLPVVTAPDLDLPNLDQVLTPQIPSKPSTNDALNDQKGSAKSGNKFLLDSIY